MTVSDVRTHYLNFFAKRSHAIIPSAPIVPENDPTTLFTSSGMQPLVPYLLGEPHPEGARLANSQLSFRAQDIEEVGDNRHTTFFEMLGNWSLGDYFKKEQLPWVYEFLTGELQLPKERLFVTCFAGDETLGLPKDTESADIWKKIGMPDDHILFYDAKKNWWSRSGTPDKMPAGEPGGPDSEIFFEFTSVKHDPSFGEQCHPNCDCGRFMEIGNSVFMEYIKDADGTFGKLPKQNVDFGGGLERLTAATLDNPDVFLIDVFDAPRAVLEKHSGKQYGDQNATRSFRIILDHIRAASRIFEAGVRPSNTEQGYVLRRLIRRAIREADRLGIKDPILSEIAGGHTTEFEEEEAQFRKTLERGLKKFNWRLDSYLRGAKGERRFESSELPPSIAFELVTTDGFPFELVEEEARARGMTIDKQQFANRMEAHRIKSREGAAQKFAGGLADHAEQTVRYHTAHHLLLKALQMVLGPEVHQRGSNITSERLRIDFSYGQKMTPEQKAEVEKIVNEKIAEGVPVIRTDMKKEEAEKLGAEHEFGATYPDTVSVYSVGPLDSAFSIEFCGGPHVSNTRELGADGKRFKIQKEEASSAGVRRIKAVLE
ncbi:MAG: Alanine--tRNA ligase [Parcubacteria group bacterium Gr01-1014_49]|nr:MAG: Alanine--tRNA ligase [Parcubacteria group bacterium Gr01-1014_49]